MTREEIILKVKYPDREDFTDAEISSAKAFLATGRDDASALPTKFVPLGSVVYIAGKRYECIKASPVLTDPCLGCDLRSHSCNSRIPQCSPFDRRDHTRVWFKLLD